MNGDEPPSGAVWEPTVHVRRIRAWWAGPAPLWQRLLMTVLGVAVLIVLFFIGLTALAIGVGLIIVLAVVAIIASWVRRFKGAGAHYGPEDSLREGVRIIRRDENA